MMIGENQEVDCTHDGVAARLTHNRVRIGAAFGVFAVAGLLTVAATDGAIRPREPLPARCPDDARRIVPGTAIQPIVDASQRGDKFCIAAGVHRMQGIRPKRGQQFYGEPGSVLSGARLLEQFGSHGKHWYAEGQTQRGRRRKSEHCLPSLPRCHHPEAVFMDDRPLLHVVSRDKLRPGTYFFDYDARRIYFYDDPRGHVVEASVSPYAFLGGASRVVIEGLTIEKYASPIQFAAIGYDRKSRGWTIRSNTIRLNYGVGVQVGSESRLENNRIHDNGELGFGCSGENILIANNEIYANGYFSGLDPFWEGGGGKCSNTSRLTLRDNYSHNNNGFGMWTDINNIHTLYEGNLIEKNRNGGISHEISYDAIIRRNVLRSNGPAAPVWLWGGAIQIQNSQNVTVHDNHIEMMGHGHAITLIQQRRGSGAYGPYITVNNRVHNNTIIGELASRGRSGSVADFDPDTLARGNNRFEGNSYYFPRMDGKHWSWIGKTYNWHDYRMIAKQDVNGKLRPKSERPEPHIDSLKWFENHKRRSAQQKSND